ncbi:hypothetical protein SDC9_37151 [bioreactor metagenome]|uniref:Uncharacterized protein n=1 Tax=bioreactor metagenome TaxID=1076179 RepID=A0A644VID1_9ZZZZ
MRRSGDAGRKHGIHDLRHVAGQAAEEGHDLPELLVIKLCAELRVGHHLHRLLEVPDRAGVEIGRRQGDVAQRRHLVGVFVGLVLGDGIAPHVLGRQDRRVGLGDDAEHLIAVAADVHAVVAAAAAGRHEERQPLLLLLGHRRIVALQPAVEGRVRGDQRVLEGGNRCGRVLEGDRVGCIGEGGGEDRRIAGDRLQHLDDMVRVRRHLDRVLHRPARLFDQVGGAPVPELGEVVGRVQHRRRVAPALLPAMPERDTGQVDAAGREVVAGVAADVMRLGQTGFEEQHLAKLGLGRGGRRIGGLRDRLEDALGIAAQRGVVDGRIGRDGDTGLRADQGQGCEYWFHG